MQLRAIAVVALAVAAGAGCLMQAPTGPDAADGPMDGATNGSTANASGAGAGSGGAADDGDGTRIGANASANGSAGGSQSPSSASVDGSAPASAPPFRVRVRAVETADVLAVTLANGTNATVRLLGVDAPTPGGGTDTGAFAGVPATPGGRRCLSAWGERAAGFVGRALPDRVTVRVDPATGVRDGRGRLLGMVAYGDTLLNEKLVADGYARAVDGPYANASAYLDAERAAREENRRLWNCRAPPARYRGEASGAGGVETGSASGATATDAECSDYQTRTAAQEAYEDGETALDADGDGIACEGLGG